MEKPVLMLASERVDPLVARDKTAAVGCPVRADPLLCRTTKVWMEGRAFRIFLEL